MNRILVPLDFSDPTFRQLQTVRSLCSAESVVELLHVQNSDDMDLTAVRRMLELHLRNLKSLVGDKTITTRSVLAEGPVAKTIQAEADRMDADLIVVGSHHHGAIYDSLVGSVARRLIASCKRTLVVVPERSSRIAPTLPVVVVAVDFSPRCDEVVREAAALARSTATRLKLLHVVPIPAEMLGLGPVNPKATVVEDLRTACMRAEARMDKFVSALALSIPVETEVRHGAVPDELVATSASPEDGLLVLGSHGHGRTYELLLGSIAQAVVRKAEQPVMLVPVHERIPKWERTEALSV